MEMGRRDMKRGGTKKQSGISSKSKKGMLKKLGLVADEKKLNYKDYKKKQSYYDEFCPSDLEDNQVSRKKKKKSKILKKNFKDCNNNGVDHHASVVPRKLRSAMKKRNLESVSKLSSVSKNRFKTGIESFNKDLIKKENQEMEGEGIVSESISKDEKEVAETLYGLAGMFTETESIDIKTCDPLSNEKETSKVDSSLIVEAEMPLELSDDKQRSSTGMVDFIDRLKQINFANATDSSTARAMETKVVTTSDTNGLALWPGLSTGSQVLSKPLSTKLPPWMDQAVSPSKNASHSSETLKIQPIKLKKCASHIYISRLIKTLQNSKSSPPAALDQTEQRRSSEMSERVLPTTTTNFKTVISPPKMYQNPHLLDLHNPKPMQEDMTPLALELYGPHSSQKQSYDFLSLLSSSGATQSHFQLPNSFPQYPISTFHNSHLPPSTSASSSHQVQQISPYLPSRYQTAYNANQQQQQQLQKRLWAASQYRQTSGNTAQQSSNQYCHKPNLSLNLTSIQQPLHVVGSSSQSYNNNYVSQQQQQQQHRLMAAAMSMSRQHNNIPSRTVMNSRQEHRFPLIYEDSRTPLQLLCNEQT